MKGMSFSPLSIQPLHGSVGQTSTSILSLYSFSSHKDLQPFTASLHRSIVLYHSSHHSEMELLGVRQPVIRFREEKYQMLELNQRLESYLCRVKLLEEENKLLQQEIYTIKKSSNPTGQRKTQEEALSLARRMMEEAWREKDHVELEVDNLMEDMEKVGIRRQNEKMAKADAQRRLSESRKELEEEQRAQIYLRKKVAHLESELLLHIQVHQENMESLQASLKQEKQVLMAPQPKHIPSIPDLGQEYSHRAAEIWQEATTNYQRQVECLEESLHQAKANMAQIHQEKRENQHQVQHLAKELESTKTKREMLEKHAVRQREEHRQELQRLQAQVDTLEVEKGSLGQQIDSLMVDRQNLLQVKMSLGLEVATYRALLDSEGPRNKRPTRNKTSSAFFLEALSKPTGNHLTSQTTAASCHFSSNVSTSHRSIPSSHTLLTSATPTWTPTLETPQRTPTKTSATNETRVKISQETMKPTEESVDHFMPENVHDVMSLASTLLQTVADSVTAEPEHKPEDGDVQKEDEPKQSLAAQLVESKTYISALISVSTDQPSSLSQTSATESWAGPFKDSTEEVSEEGKDEDTEVSMEIARISHAQRVAWEENKSVAEDEKEDVSEKDVRSENINESHIFEYGGTESNDYAFTSSQVRKNTNNQASSLLEQGPLYSVGGLGYMEEINEDLMRADEQHTAIDISEEMMELMNSETEAVIDTMWDRQEEDEGENERKDMSPDSEMEDEGEMGMEEKGIENEIMAEREHEEIEVFEADIAVQEESLPRPRGETVDLDHHESLESTVPPAELHDQTLNKDHSLPEEYEKEENQCDEDDSPNISGSLRTDPGECDSYIQENTLADTRPLIHYKSDEETDMNPQASHVGDSETSDIEDEKNRMDGGQWGENPSKRFNTMEDLSEEPDMDVIGEMMTEEIVQTEEALDNREYMILHSEHDDSRSHESLVVDEVEKESARNEPKENHEEEGDDILRDDDQDLKVDEQNENLCPKQANQADETANLYNSKENVNMEPFSCFNHPSSLPDMAFPEKSQQIQPESFIDVSSTLTLIQDPNFTNEPPIEEEDNQNISIHTNVDLMDNLSLEREINSQLDMPNSDFEECISSEDESPNASQYFQKPTLLEPFTFNEEALNLGGQFTNDGVYKADNDVPEEVISKDLMEKSTEEHNASQIDDWEIPNIGSTSKSMPTAEEITHSMDGNTGQLSPSHETENLDSPKQMLSEAKNIFGMTFFEEHLEREVESFSKEESSMIEIFKRNNQEEEEFQSKEKESEIHSFFSSNLKEDNWSEGKMEMAAAYAPCENFAHDPIHLNQSMVFGEEWRGLGVMSAANGNTKEEMVILKSQSQDKKLQYKDKQTEQKEMVQSDDSVDDGDSWSSGDE
ncbi:nestin-like [Xyrauchen texanus]|uniref:nestin-like n=1 Tax=Xyrauchen texanus TaxID=154827 RepID=UPI002241CB36|nr:nestin-like [Xyrauchen texanus]